MGRRPLPTARKWVRRYRERGEAGLLDHSSAPKRIANRTPDDRVEAILSLRRVRFTGLQIAAEHELLRRLAELRQAVEGAPVYVEPHLRLEIIEGYAQDGSPLFERVPLRLEAGAHNRNSSDVPGYPAILIL